MIDPFREQRRFPIAFTAMAAMLALMPAIGLAADFYTLPTNRPVVDRCEAQGLRTVPQTDICMKFGGFVRFDMSAVGKNWIGTNGYVVKNIAVDGYSVAPSGVVPTINAQSRSDIIEMYSEGRLHTEVRADTEYGTVRGLVEIEATDNETRTGGPFGLRHAYVQFGNWTLGKTWSTFLHQASGPSYSDPYSVVGDNSTAIRRNQIRYTQTFGREFSLAVAIEDQNYNTPPAAIVGLGPDAPIVPASATSFSVSNDKSNMPDLVAALKWDKVGTGSAQISAALHQNSYAEMLTIAGTPVPGSDDTSMGFALLAGLALDLPSGDGDKFTLLANYTEGASQYLQDDYGSSTEIVWGRCGSANCILDDIRKWSVVSSLTHYWSPRVSTSFGAGYSRTDYGAVGTALKGLPAVPAALEVASLEGFANVQWQPTARTTFMLDIHYGRIDYRGFDLDPSIAGIQDAQGAWAGTFEVTRRF